MMSWIELDRAGLTANVARIRQLAGDRDVCLVVKANAYGHGIAEVVPVLQELGVAWLGVQTVEEVRAVRSAGYTAKVVMLGPFNIFDLPYISQEQVRVALRSIVQAQEVATWTVVHKKGVSVHLEVDLGMHRYGLSIGESLECRAALEGSHAELEGLFGHYPAVDSQSAQEVQQRWQEAFQALPGLAVYHVAKSEALTREPLEGETMVRVGLAVYGEETAGTKSFLQWKARIQQVHDVLPGETIGYDRRYVAEQPMRIGVLPVGYAEGVPFQFTNRGQVLHADGSVLPIVGSVCMNACMVVLLPQHGIGDEVLLAPIAANQVLEGVSRYELFTRMHPDLPREMR